MTIAYALLTRPDVAVFVSALQRESHQAKIIHVKRLNVLLRWLQSNPKGITYPVMKYPTVLLQISDSSYKARATDGLSVRGLVSVRVSLDDVIAGKAETPCHVLDYVSKAQRHVTRSTFSSELFAATDAVDSGLLQSIVLHELQHGVVTPSEAKGLIEGTAHCAVGLALAVDAKSVRRGCSCPQRQGSCGTFTTATCDVAQIFAHPRPVEGDVLDRHEIHGCRWAHEGRRFARSSTCYNVWFVGDAAAIRAAGSQVTQP